MRNRAFRERDWDKANWEGRFRETDERRQQNKILFGVFLALIGVAWIVKISLNLPLNLYQHWPFLIIITGIMVGLKNNFRNSAWWILCLIGVANLVEKYFPQYDDFTLPGILIVVGVAIALRPTKKKCPPSFKVNRGITEEGTLDIDVVFGGRKEIVTAKDFASGNIAVTFAGCEISFMQAEIAGDTAVLDLRVSFGGVEIVVPSHWQIQNEINPAFGNIEDERKIQTAFNSEQKKTLILRGSCAFGNIEIQSY